MNLLRSLFNGSRAEAEKSPTLKKIIEEIEADSVLDTDASLTAEQAVHEELDGPIAELTEELAEAKGEEARAEAAWKAARARRSKVEHELVGLRTSRESRLGQIVAERRMKAPECIDAFLAELRDLEAAAMRMSPQVAEVGKPNVSGQRQRISNHASIVERLEVIREVRRETDSLKSKAIAPEQAAEAIERLRGEIPEVQDPRDLAPDGPFATVSSVPEEPRAKPELHRRYGAGK